MLAAFQMYGLQPGPLLFSQDSELVWGLIASLYVSNVLLLVLNLPLIGVWVQLLRVPRPLLFAAVLAFSTLFHRAAPAVRMDRVPGDSASCCSMISAYSSVT